PRALPRPARRRGPAWRCRARRRRDVRLHPAVRYLRLPASRVPPRPRQPRHGHRGSQGAAPSPLARGLPPCLLDHARRRRLRVRERVRHDRALLAAVRERAARPLRWPRTRAAALARTAVAPDARARSGHAGAHPSGRRRAPLPSRPRQCRVRGGRAHGGPRTHHRRRRDRGHGAGRDGAAPRVRPPPRRARRGMNEPAREPGCATAGRLATLVDAAIEARAGRSGRALGCLVGGAVVVKSGRDDSLSAPAFHRALEAVDPALAATVVTAYWPGGDRACEEAAFQRAAVVVASGTDETVTALAGRLGARLIANGERTSVAAVSREGLGRDEPLAERLALDIALH